MNLLDHSLRLLEAPDEGPAGFRSAAIIARCRDTIRADESQLQQVFMNLLLNAVDAVGNNGDVIVGTENAGEHLLIFIRDTGMGIPTENLTRMFEPFFTTKKNGTGLGLAICRRIGVEGNITARSRCTAG